MAQQLQPGTEGDEDEKMMSSQYGTYQCVFRKASDSLYLMMKDRKSKRSFTNTFSKSTLIEMDLKQPIDKIINMLETAKSGSTSELKFELRFTKAENDKKVSMDQMAKTYEKGDVLFVIVSVNQSWFAAQYQFKLLEQQREEADILRDIIQDMQDEMDQLKLLAQKTTGIAVWKRSSKLNGNIPLDVEHVPTTLKRMVSLSDDKKTVTIGIAGIYRICVELNYVTYNEGCTSDNFNIALNGNVVYQRLTGRPNGFGFMECVLPLKKNDKIVFYCGCMHTTNEKLNSFTIQKL
eukprot:547634_1